MTGTTRVRPGTQQWSVVVPLLVLGIPFGIFLLTKPNIATGAFGSGQAIAINAAGVIAWIVLQFVVLPRVLRPAWARGAAMSAVALVVLWLVVAPAYIDKTVVEAFPLSMAPSSAGVQTPDVDGGPATAPVGDVDPPGIRPDVVGVGELRGINHRASGHAALYHAPDGRHVVGLEDIDIEPGPDYFVWIVPGSDRESPGDGARLDRLRGNKGTQYYEVPPDFVVPDEVTVLVWCRAFGVPIANAALRPT